MLPIIKTQNVSRCFPVGRETIHALEGVSLTVEPGALTLLKGRSGSGKTTLINLLGALDKPTTGEIFFLDSDITKMTEENRDKVRRVNMGFVFQSVALVSFMSAYENVELGLRIAGYNARERKQRAEECLAFVGLFKRMHHRAHELSGGEQQRVAIARAIAHKPKVIFADEPTAQLDTHMGLQVMKVFSELVAKESLTVIMTSHDPNIIELADRVYELQDGKIISGE